jgi:hypothetical protein
MPWFFALGMIAASLLLPDHSWHDFAQLLLIGALGAVWLAALIRRRGRRSRG